VGLGLVGVAIVRTFSMRDERAAMLTQYNPAPWHEP